MKGSRLQINMYYVQFDPVRTNEITVWSPASYSNLDF